MADPFIYSEEGTIALEYLPVNDAPTITNIETRPIEYIQGAAPVLLSQTITIADVDNQLIDSAWVSISGNYNGSEDVLLLDTQAEVPVNFDKASGTLLIAGEGSKSVYEGILAAVAYQNTNNLTADTAPKSITFSVSDGEARSNSLSRQLIITEILPELDIVNAFTPNNDGVNDTWDFINLDQFSDVNISVFNNRRQVVFECSDTDCAWDGTYNGVDLAAGTYFYSIALNNGRRLYEGPLTILR